MPVETALEPTVVSSAVLVCENNLDWGCALDLRFLLWDRREDFFSPILKFAPIGESNSQDLRSTTQTT
jgi:hypothetical protein